MGGKYVKNVQAERQLTAGLEMMMQTAVVLAAVKVDGVEEWMGLCSRSRLSRQ